MSSEARAGVYDVICRDERLRVFILEMQTYFFKFLELRLMFYDFHLFNSQVSKGKLGFRNVPPVICICIMENSLYPDEKNYVWEFMFRDKSGKVLSERAQVRLVELGKFHILQKDLHLVKTDEDKLFYTMKYAHLIDMDNPAKVPSFWKEDWLAGVLEKLEVAKMDPEERAILDMSILKSKMLAAQHEDELQEVFEKGKKKGEEKGEIKGKKEGIKEGEKLGEQKGQIIGLDKSLKIIELHLQGKTPAQISKLVKVPLKETQAFIKRFTKLK